MALNSLSLLLLVLTLATPTFKVMGRSLPAGGLQEPSSRIKVLGSGILGLWLIAAAVEVVEHEVHIGSLLSLEVVNDGFIAVHLYLDAPLRLPREGSRLVEVVATTTLDLRLVKRVVRLLLLLLKVLPFPLLLRLLVITDIEGLPSRVAHSGRRL